MNPTPRHSIPWPRLRLSMMLALGLALALPGSSPAMSDDESGDASLGVEQDLGPPAGEPLTGDRLESATRDLASRLRCPVCQGLSVADSTSVSALAMRDEIHELLSKGYSEEQIVASFERSFGEFVLLVPKARGFNLLVWLLPVVGLLAGLVIVLRQTRPASESTPSGEPRSAGTRGADTASTGSDELADYRARVLRELGGGDAPE